MAINYQGGNDVVVTGAFAPFMKTLQQNYLYEQEKQQQIRKETNALKAQAQKEVSKINPNGLWKADLPEFNKNYNELKQINFELSKTNDPYKAQELSMQLNEKALGLITFAQNSSETSKRYSSYLNGLPTLAGKGDVNKARAHAEQALSRPSSELGLDYFDKSQFMFKYDPTKVDSAVSKVASDLLKNVPEQRTLANTVTGSGGRRTDIWNVTKTANETQVLEQLSRLAKGGNRDVQSYVEDLMTNNGVDFNTAVGMLAEEFSPKFSTQSTSETSADKSKGITVNVNTGAQNFTDPANSIVDNYVIATAKQPIKGERGTTPKGGEVSLKNYLQFNQTQNIGGVLKGIDPETGQTVSPEGYSTKAQVLGLGTDQSGRVYAHIGYQPDPNIDEIKTMIVDADRYLNTSQISKTKASYVNELARRGVKLQGQNKQTQQAQSKSTSSPKQETVAERMRRLAQQK